MNIDKIVFDVKTSSLKPNLPNCIEIKPLNEIIFEVKYYWQNDICSLKYVN